MAQPFSRSTSPSRGVDVVGARSLVGGSNIPPLFFAPSFLPIVFLFGILYAPCDLTLAYLLPSTTPFPFADGAGIDWIAGRMGMVKLARAGLYAPLMTAACSGRCNWGSRIVTRCVASSVGADGAVRVAVMVTTSFEKIDCSLTLAGLCQHADNDKSLGTGVGGRARHEFGQVACVTPSPGVYRRQLY